MHKTKKKTGTLEAGYGILAPSRRSAILQMVDVSKIFEVTARIEKTDRVARPVF